MAGAYVKFNPKHSDRYVVAGYGELGLNDDGGPFGPLDIAQEAYLHSLELAMRRQLMHEAGNVAGPLLMRISDIPPEYFNEDDSPATDVRLCLFDGTLYVEVDVHNFEQTEVEQYVGVIAPLLKRRRSRVVAIESEAAGDAILQRFRCSIPRQRGGTVGDAYRFGKEVSALLNALDGSGISAATALDLLKAGRFDLFKGQPESGWLEAKGTPYEGPNWKYELAKDVAAFANAGGGLIALGMTTTDKGDGDVITGFREVAFNRVNATTYRNYVSQLVYPTIVGFDVVRCEGRRPEHGVVALVVPLQRPEDQPFLVRGVSRRGKVLGAHVLVPTRRGAMTELLDPAAIHGFLRLGRRVVFSESPLDH